ncbi:nickel-dependent lactate racemase [Syntrophomonas erecta]
MRVNTPFGKDFIQFEIPDTNYAGTLSLLGPAKENRSNEQMVSLALSHPVGTPRLKEIIRCKQPKTAVIIVNDITRPTPYKTMLPPLLHEMEEAGIKPENIKLVVATGIHRPHSYQENLAIFGADVCSRYKIENHDCDSHLLSLGRLSNGMELIINQTVAEADLLVTTGLVGLHYFAGYSGGRKSILPGVAARSLIELNHKMMDDPRACLGNYEDNPVNTLMLEAARMVGVDFILNVVTSSHDKIVYAAAGDLYYAWMEAVRFCEKMSVVSIKEKADIIIAGCGGYPKDINIYQAQKALDAAALAVKKGGTIILIAECPEGLGEDTFEKWVTEARSPQDIRQRFHRHFELGGHKAYAICRTLEQADILLYSCLNPAIVRSIFMQPVTNLETAINQALEKHGSGASILYIPEAPKLAIKVSGENIS